MIAIATLHAGPDGFRGQVRTLCFDVEIVIAPLGRDLLTAKEYIVRRGPGDFGTQIGRGVRRPNDPLGDSIALLLDDPSFAAPIRAALYPSLLGGGQHDLFWRDPVDRWRIE